MQLIHHRLTYWRNCLFSLGILKARGMKGLVDTARLTLLVMYPEPGKWFTCEERWHLTKFFRDIFCQSKTYTSCCIYIHTKKATLKNINKLNSESKCHQATNLLATTSFKTLHVLVLVIKTKTFFTLLVLIKYDKWDNNHFLIHRGVKY